jgi:hypothetical protein
MEWLSWDSDSEFRSGIGTFMPKESKAIHRIDKVVPVPMPMPRTWRETIGSRCCGSGKTQKRLIPSRVARYLFTYVVCTDIWCSPTPTVLGWDLGLGSSRMRIEQNQNTLESVCCICICCTVARTSDCRYIKSRAVEGRYSVVSSISCHCLSLWEAEVEEL